MENMKLTPTQMLQVLHEVGYCYGHNMALMSRFKHFQEEAACSTAESINWDDIAERRLGQKPGRVGQGSAVPFRLEVSKSYARRDGTGPVSIVSKGGGFFNDVENDVYYEDGRYTAPKLPADPRDLVALWQAEAQAPQTDADEYGANMRVLGERFGQNLVAPLVVERDALKARVAELENALKFIIDTWTIHNAQIGPSEAITLTVDRARAVLNGDKTNG